MTAPRPAILAVLLAAAAASAAADPCAEAQRQFADGHYAAGRQTLVDVLDSTDATTDQRARARDALAHFYEQLVGSELQPALHWQAVVDMSLPATHPILANARKQLERLAENEVTYADPNRMVEDANFLSDDPGEFRTRIADLRAAAQQYPDYPHMARLYHTIGVNYMWLEEYGPAIDAFDKALEIRPAIDLIHPTSAFRDTAAFEWMHLNVPAVAWSVIAAIAAIWAAAFLALRRWRTLQPRHALVAAIVLAGWCALFFGTVAVARHFDFPQPAESFVTPIEIHSSLGETGAEHLGGLFWYGLAAVAGSALFTTVSAAIRRGPLRLGANLIVSLALSGALTMLAYLENYSRNVVYLHRGDDPASYLTSTFNFHVKTIEINQPEPPPESDEDRQEDPRDEPAGGQDAPS